MPLQVCTLTSFKTAITNCHFDPGYVIGLGYTEFLFFSVVAPKVDDIDEHGKLNILKGSLKSYIDIDSTGEKGVFVVPTTLAPKKIVFSGTGNLENDYDDVRSYAEAAEAGIKKALKIGSKAPLLFFNVAKFPHADLVTILGALKALYVR